MIKSLQTDITWLQTQLTESILWIIFITNAVTDNKIW